MIQNILDHIDWLSVKLTGLSIVMAFITGSEIVMALAGAASISTILYNWYRYRSDKKNKKK